MPPSLLVHFGWHWCLPRGVAGTHRQSGKRWLWRGTLRALLYAAAIAWVVTGQAAPTHSPALLTATKPLPPPVTLGQLAALQSRKLEADWNSRAAVLPAAPASTGAVAVAAGGNPVRPSTPVEPLTTLAVTVLATYGTVTSQWAELEIDGVTRVVSEATRLGPVTVNAVGSGQVRLTVLHRGKQSSHILRPGERIEIRP